PASHLYVKNKEKACEAVGIYVADHKLPTSTTQEELLTLIDKVNRDPQIHGILVQLPLPKQIDSKVVLNAVSADKDADGFHPYNIGRLVEGNPVFEACTPKGVIKMIESTGIGIEGKRAVVLGRSNIVGKPVALMLLHRNATVTVCHSKTKDLPAVCREAEILVVAIGKPKFVTADMVREGAVVVDVGVNRGADGNSLLDNAKGLLGKVHGVNVTDNTAAILRAGSMSICRLLYEMGHDPVMQMTCRDRNRLAIQSDLLSAHLLGIRNILCLTGDYPTVGDHKEAKPVYDLDS